MIQAAIYGKGGIGKSTTVCNISAALAEAGYKVLQIGCDPKADSTFALLGGQPIHTVVELLRQRPQGFTLADMVTVGYGGVLCVEAGGPTPGLGCAGRGISAALEKLRELGAFSYYQPDVVLYDVLGDVVCGGFSVPMRAGWAQRVFILTSGEKMALYAARNIAAAVANFQERGYARLGGIILNRREVKNEEEKVTALAADLGAPLIGRLSRSPLVTEAEELEQTVIETFPDSPLAGEYRALAQALLAACGQGEALC